MSIQVKDRLISKFQNTFGLLNYSMLARSEVVAPIINPSTLPKPQWERLPGRRTNAGKTKMAFS